MRQAKEILDEWAKKRIGPVKAKECLSLIESVQADARAEIDEVRTIMSEAYEKVFLERDALLAEKETWGNEFNAVVILKEQLEKANSDKRYAQVELSRARSNKRLSDAKYLILQEERDAFRNVLNWISEVKSGFSTSEYMHRESVDKAREVLARFPKPTPTEKEGG